MKKLFTLLISTIAFAFADSNVHLDPKITNAINPNSSYALWTQFGGVQNENLYPSNTEVKINSTAFDNYARFSFYRKDNVTAIEPALFNSFAENNRIPYSTVWDSLSGDNKRQTFYSRGDLAFMQNSINYVCPSVSFFTTSDREYSMLNSRFENVYKSWIATSYGDRVPVRLVNNNSAQIICYKKNGTDIQVLFNIVPSSAVDSYIYPMTFNKVHEYNLQEASDKNLEYVILWSWNHMNNEYGEKRFMDNGRFDLPTVKGIRINDAVVNMTPSNGKEPEIIANVVPKGDENSDKEISITSEFPNNTSDVIEYNSPSMTQTMSKAIAVAHASAFKTAYSSKAKIKMPFLGDVEHTITIDYTGTTTNTETVTDTTAITIPSQKIKVNPGCSVRVAQMLNTGKENGLINLTSQVGGNVTSNGVAWKTDGTQVLVRGSYSLYDLLKSNNPSPSEKWITLDDKNKVVNLHDIANYVATKDNYVQTRVYMKCGNKTTAENIDTIPAQY